MSKAGKAGAGFDPFFLPLKSARNCIIATLTAELLSLLLGSSFLLIIDDYYIRT
jgi:hypothetical protein